MKLPPAKSVDIDGVRCYEIKFNGETYICEPKGQKWLCNGIAGTLKDIKFQIANGDIYWEDNEEEEWEEPKETTVGLWDCDDPCFLLIDLLGAIRCKLDERVWLTLGNYGWLTEDGKNIDDHRVDHARGKVSSNAMSIEKGKQL